MYSNFVFGDASEALPHLLDAVLHGREVPSRNGSTLELTHVGITLGQPWRREILVPGRKPNIAAQIFETMWVLAGRDDMESLVRYLPRAAQFSDDGKRWRAGYGARLRSWDVVGDSRGVDQLAYVVDLLQRDPASRQAVMSIWDPEIDTEPGKDIPCNNWLSFLIRNNQLDLHVAIRSNDAIWGWSGINAFEWSALQEIVAGLVGVEVGSLHFSTTSFHLYDRHFTKARNIVNSGQIVPTYQDSPRFDSGIYQSRSGLEHLFTMWFSIERCIRTGDTDVEKAVDAFPEPMLRSWLRVLQWWWTGDRRYLLPLAGTRLEAATKFSVQPPTNQVGMPVAAGIQVSNHQSEFMKDTVRLHNEKHTAYGDSWKRRGEMLGIMANIARKVDRLGQSETSDETSADTATDLMVYLAKYRTWLIDQGVGRTGGHGTTGTRFSDKPMYANDLLIDLDRSIKLEPVDVKFLEQDLRDQFDKLEQLVVAGSSDRHLQVDGMMARAYRLARFLWEAEEIKKEHPHSRACGIKKHDHGPDCHSNCPSCGGQDEAPTALGQTIAERNATRRWSPEQ